MTRYHSPRELAHALQDTAPIKMGLLFYNEHSPDTTPVWLVPDPYEKPAHHRAKIGVWPWGEDGQEVFVQWCVEKGVAGSAAPHFPPSDVLKPDWAWAQFTERAHSKAFDAQLKAAETTAQQPLTVRLTLDTATPGRGRDYRGTKSQELIWRTQAGQLTDVQLVGEAHFNDRLADAAPCVKSPYSFPKRRTWIGAGSISVSGWSCHCGTKPSAPRRSGSGCWYPGPAGFENKAAVTGHPTHKFDFA